jgi:hypothetical protein
MLADPDDLDVMFAFARVASQLGRYEPAISTLERMLVYNADLPRVRLELGVLYFRLGANEVAQAYFERVAERNDLPPAVRTRVDSYLAEIREREKRHLFSGSLFVGARYDSNANAGPEDATVQFVIGGDRVVSGTLIEGQADADSSLVTTGFLRHAYDLDNRFDETWESTALGHVTRYADMSELDVDFFELTTGPRLAFAPAELTNARIRPFLAGQVIRVDRDVLARGAGGGVEFSMPLDARLFFQSSYEILYQDYRDTRALPSASERTGVEQRVQGQLTLALDETFRLVGRLGANHRAADAGWERYREGFGELGALARYSAPSAITAWPWTAFVSVRATRTTYGEPDPTVAPGTRREDNEYRFAARNTFRVNETWAVELRLTHTINNSNITNYEFDNTSVTLGGVIRF